MSEMCMPNKGWKLQKEKCQNYPQKLKDERNPKITDQRKPQAIIAEFLISSPKSKVDPESMAMDVKDSVGGRVRCWR